MLALISHCYARGYARGYTHVNLCLFASLHPCSSALLIHMSAYIYVNRYVYQHVHTSSPSVSLFACLRTCPGKHLMPKAAARRIVHCLERLPCGCVCTCIVHVVHAVRVACGVRVVLVCALYESCVCVALVCVSRARACVSCVHFCCACACAGDKQRVT